MFRDDNGPPIIMDVDDEIIVKRSLEKYSVVCERGMECFSFGMFDPSVTGGKGHARLFWEKDCLYIQDLGSSNGTYLIINQKEIPLKGWRGGVGGRSPEPSEKIRINSTQKILLGSMEFTVELEVIQNLHVEGDYLAEGASKISIKDSIVQRSVIGGMGSKQDGVTCEGGGKQVEIKDSVIIRSNVGNKKSRCGNCGAEIQVDVGVCPKCGTELRGDVDRIAWE